MENNYVSSIRQTVRKFLNSLWHLPLWTRAMWLAKWDRGPGVWKEVLDAHKWSQLLLGAVALSSLVHLEWFTFGKWGAGIQLGWGRETMDSVWDLLSLASPCISGRVPTGKSDMWTWSATEGPDRIVQCGVVCIQSGVRGITLTNITLEEIAGELTFIYVPGKESLRGVWQAFQVYSFRHKLQRLDPLPLVS